MTAVEWLQSELTEVERNLINKTFLQLNNSIAGHRLKDIFEQAKEMEKQQLKEIYLKGIENYDPTFKNKEDMEIIEISSSEANYIPHYHTKGGRLLATKLNVEKFKNK